MPEERIAGAVDEIKQELEERLKEFTTQGKLLEAQRLSAAHPLRHRDAAGGGLLPGHRELQPAAVRPAARLGARHAVQLLSRRFPAVRRRIARHRAADPRHVRRRPQPQGDAGRARLPPAQRAGQPAAEVRGVGKARLQQVVYVSATPGPYELEKTGGEVVEQVIRPTGLLDPEIEVAAGPRARCRICWSRSASAAAGERVLVTTLTKRLAEDLAAYFSKQDVRCKWLHSDLDAFERVELLRDLRQGHFDVLVGVNLLREGLDLPEVSLVAILDADKEGFLRSETSLMQTIGRSARNVNAKVILYADKVTDSMQRAIDETAAPPRDAGGVQPAARHHAGDDPQEHSRGHRGRGGGPRPGQRRRRPRRRHPVHHRGVPGRAGGRDDGRGRGPGVRAGGGHPRPHRADAPIRQRSVPTGCQRSRRRRPARGRASPGTPLGRTCPATQKTMTLPASPHESSCGLHIVG